MNLNRLFRTLLAIVFVLVAAVAWGTGPGEQTDASLPGTAVLTRPAISWETFSTQQRPIAAVVNGEQPVQLAIRDLGPRDGTAVVFVHGVPTSSWMYRYVLHDLEGAGLRLIAVDNLGYGLSEKPVMEYGEAARYYAADRQAARLREALRALGVHEAVFVVHDAGGPIVWELLAGEPGLAAGLVVLNTIGAPGGFSPPVAMDSRIVQGVMQAAAFQTDEAVRSLICAMVAEPEEIDTPLQLEGYYVPFRDGTALPYTAFLASLDMIRSRIPAYATLVRSLEVPAGIYWGAEDRDLLARPSVEWFAEALGIPDDRVITDPNARHLVAEEAPEAIADLIRQVAADAAP